MEFTKYERTDVIQSMYHYPDTEILINNFNIRDSKTLFQVESDLTQNRLFELYNSPIKGRFGFRHFIRIHEYIFQDIYPFAGKLRLENIWKGDTFFCKSEFIENSLKKNFEELKEENYLLNLSKADFIYRLSHYMSELNIIHPYREGNGRAIREYIRELALKNNKILNWHCVNNEELLEAAIQAVDFNYKLLQDCISKCLEE